MARPSLTLYCDVVSPFSYLAFYMVKNSPVFKDVQVSYVPVLLGAIMKKCNNAPPLSVKNKGAWVGKERLRWAKAFNIPIVEKVHPKFPQNTIHTQRALTAISLLHPEQLPHTLEVFCRRMWVDGVDMSEPDQIRDALNSVYGESEAEKIIDMSSQDKVKDLLRLNTDGAFDSGSFGLPWYAATNSAGQTEHYWGFDHLAQAAEHLGIGRPMLDASGEKGWQAML